MSEPANSGAQAVPPSQVARAPFPAIRLLYALGFGILAYFVLILIFILAVVQFIVVAINGHVNQELRHFCINLVQYLLELVAFITFVRDVQPFPIGAFPKNPTPHGGA